jgi:hypothetical protein
MFTIRTSPQTITISCLVLASISLATGMLYFRSEAIQARRDPQRLIQEESKRLVAEVGLIMRIPDEEPTIAVVTDPSVLKDQPFFSRAEAGMKVLIFTEARRAILYDPAGRKVVEVASFDIGGSQ